MEIYSRMVVGVSMMSNLLEKEELLHGMKQLLELRRMLKLLELKRINMDIFRRIPSIIRKRI
nr:MAG TPA: hypothetical protein [Bacteriophage sp.]